MEITSLASSGLSSQAVSIVLQVFESMEEAVVIADSKRCIVMMNTAAEKLFGCRQADVVGLPTKVFYADEKDFEARGQNTFNPSVNQISDPYIVRYQSMDGHIFYGETIGGPIRDESLSEVYFFAIIRDVSKRVRSEQTMSRLHSITSSRMLEYERRIYELLKLGCEHFGMLMGIVSCIEGQNYVVEAVYHPEDAVPEGAAFELENTYCVHTLDADGPTGFYHVAHSRIQYHPCYLNFGLEAYIGCPIEVDGERYGTINFSSPDPVEAFDGSDLNLVRLFAEWVGHEIARNRDLEVG
ncbi:hypothetical protein BFW38_06280 [Terasakiispira papahanaumokuakeensis]|uniref:PAS domain-containing protein n=1 Tax=Terasakiispira papahanaumokuakeensis TaxID=197479 RepID=A0A1E2V869_9GAMM|nr:PAS domain S-box protein [Terasakiispira papahanaumokuakeensis]ODC03208.1 hypothetical protein BFW38_06280 [Terasakiispira papahanaumokuakeensis]